MIPTNLNQKIEIISTVIDENDAFQSSHIEVVKTLYANILTVNNSEIFQAYSNNQQLMFSFRVHLTKFTNSLIFNTTQYQIRYKGQLFNIISAIPYKDTYIDIKAVAVK